MSKISWEGVISFLVNDTYPKTISIEHTDSSMFQFIGLLDISDLSIKDEIILHEYIKVLTTSKWKYSQIETYSINLGEIITIKTAYGWNGLRLTVTMPNKPLEDKFVPCHIWTVTDEINDKGEDYARLSPE